MKTFSTLLIICLAIITTSCDETKRVIDAAGTIQLSGTYDVTSVNSTKNAINQTMIFSALEKKVNGMAGCNSYFGNYTLDLYAINFNGVGSTKKMCADNEMTAENAFFKALDNTGSYSIENDVLTLYSKTDRTVLLTAKKQK